MIVRVWTENEADWPLGLGVPEVNGIPPIEIAQAGREFPGDDTTPPSGRYLVEHWFTADQLGWLAAQDGVHITQAGKFDGPEWPFQEEEI